MPPEINPYQPPAEIEEDSANRAPQREIDYFSFCCWPFALALNLIVPLMLAWSITDKHGRIGMFSGIGLILAGGWIVCFYYPSIARRMIGSAVFTAITQVFPIPQMIAGMIALSVVERLEANLQDDVDRGFVLIFTELGGFVATMIVGAFLLIFSFGLLFVSEFMIPSEKRDSRSKPRR
jgi:hypothetical protein